VGKKREKETKYSFSQKIWGWVKKEYYLYILAKLKILFFIFKIPFFEFITTGPFSQ
jgi:hypothetical protein